MHHFTQAWVTISGQAFANDLEMRDELELLFGAPDPEMDGDSGALASYTEEQKREAFRNVAQRKIDSLFPDDLTMKINETIIDMNTFRT